MTGPIIVGGSGHSGTRIFAQILSESGIAMGIPRLSRHSHSYDLMQIDLLSRWVPVFLSGEMGAADKAKMARQFQNRLRLFFPMRLGKWGFKNPRTMLLLPFFNELFPDMKFVHVVRDGRDMSFGNAFAHSNEPHLHAFLEENEYELSVGEKMMLYWGRSNERAKTFGNTEMSGRYFLIRFEDLCANPESMTEKLIEFGGGSKKRLGDIASLVRKPKSVGRWRSFEDAEVEKAILIGQDYLREFAYS